MDPLAIALQEQFFIVGKEKLKGLTKEFGSKFDFWVMGTDKNIVLLTFEAVKDVPSSIFVLKLITRELGVVGITDRKSVV